MDRSQFSREAASQGQLRLLVCRGDTSGVVASASLPFSTLQPSSQTVELIFVNPTRDMLPATITIAVKCGLLNQVAMPPAPVVIPSADNPAYADLVTKLSMNIGEIPPGSKQRTQFEVLFG